MSGNDLDLPFERNPEPVPIDLTGALLSGGVVVMSVLLSLPGGTLRALAFQFGKPDGTGFYPPVVLAPDDFDQLEKLSGLIDASVESLKEQS